MKHHQRREIVERLFKAADALFDARGRMRREVDMLQDAYDDATGAGPGLYADPIVRETRDVMHELDHEIGHVARQMEHLARLIKKEM